MSNSSMGSLKCYKKCIFYIWSRHREILSSHKL